MSTVSLKQTSWAQRLHCLRSTLLGQAGRIFVKECSMKSKFLLIALLAFAATSLHAETGDGATDTTPKPTKKKIHATTNEDSADEGTTPVSISGSNYKQVRLGILGGMTAANMSVNSSSTGVSQVTSSRTGFGGGAYLEIPFTEHFSLVPQMLYVQEGGTVTSAGNITFNYDTFQIPVLAQLKWGTDLYRFEVFAGPAASIAVNKSVSSGATGVTPGPSDLRGFDINFQAGIAGELTITRSINVLLNVRYIPGVLDQDKIDGQSTIFSSWLFMTGLSIGL